MRAALDSSPEHAVQARTTSALWLAWIGSILALAVLAAIFTPGFATAANLSAILQTSALTGIVAVTMTPLTLSGSFGSLSTQQSAMLAAVLFAYLISHDYNVAISVIIVLFAVTVTGVIQGLVVAAGLNPIITTLAAGSVLAGSVAAATQTTSISLTGHQISWLGGASPLGIPVSVLYFAAITAVVTWTMKRTVIGRYTLLSGANRETAELSGVPVGSTVVWAFVILSVGSAFAGIIGASQLGYANSQLFSTMIFDVIAAVVIGGTAITGGFGSPLWSAGGAVLISAINNVLILQGFSFGIQITVIGVLVVGSIVIMQLLPGRREL